MTDENDIRKSLGLPPIQGRKEQTKRTKEQHSKNQTKKDYDGIKVIAKKVFKTLKGPSVQEKYDKMMTLEEKLETEQKQKAEIERANLHIKELKTTEKEMRRTERKQKLAKVKRFLHVF